MVHAWFAARLPAESSAGGYTRDRFEAELNAPLTQPTKPDGRRSGRVSTNANDSGRESLAQFAVVG